MIRIFIGYDDDEPVAFHVLAHSILRHATAPVSITPLVRAQLAGIHPRARGELESTDFSITRFLVPYLCDYEGWALFMDCDMLNTSDIAELWAMRDDRFAVMCVQHDYSPSGETKFLGRPQTRYEKKNWSSLMLMNAGRCRALTPEVVATASGLHLHRFEWLDGDEPIGALPSGWNHLVGEMRRADVPPLIHYTLGGPWFEATRDCEHAELWRREHARMSFAANAGD